MGVSETGSRAIYDALKASGVRVISALPETWLVHVLRMAQEDPEMRLVEVAREEEGVGICAGAHLAGVSSALLMQNHGFLQSVNAIVSLCMLYRIPLVMLISDRGHLGEKDPWQTEGGRYTRPLLDALNVIRDDLSRAEAVPVQVEKAITLAHAALAPVALLMTRDLMWEEGR